MTTRRASETDGRLTRRELVHRGLAAGLTVAGLGGIADLVQPESALASGSRPSTRSLITAAKRDGHLNIIACPRDWADYGRMIDTFQAKYGLGITDANPDGSSAQEIQTIKSLRGQGRAPDTVDVSPVYANIGKQQGLFSAYRVSTWNSIPAKMKDPAGYWTGDYWGVVSFGANRSVVPSMPRTWEDLTSPSLKGKVAIDGDPRQSGSAFAAVMAASLAHGGSLNNIEPGIRFFARLKRLGNYIPALASTANIARGQTPVAIKWDYLNLALRDEFRNNPRYTVAIPEHGVYGGFYCQAISKTAPHPNAARLWLEYLYSDAGQLTFLRGYTHPARYHDLVRRGKVPLSLAAKLPPAAAYRHVHFATLPQFNAAATVLQQQWGPLMGA